MPQITFKLADGSERIIEPAGESSIMRAAITNAVPGIVGECGGQAMCATCHVYVDEGYRDGLPEMSDDEDEMLDCATAERLDGVSRLGCQIVVGRDLDEIVVTVPGTQV